MTFLCRELGDPSLGEWSSAAVDYTFQALDESLIGVALVESSSQRKVLDKMKKNKRRTADDSGWLISESRCAQLQTFPTHRWHLHWVNLSLHSCDDPDRPGSCFDHPVTTGALPRVFCPCDLLGRNSTRAHVLTLHACGANRPGHGRRIIFGSTYPCIVIPGCDSCAESERCSHGCQSQLPATKLTLFVLCKTKSKREPPCELVHAPPKIVLRDAAGNTRVLPGLSDEPWWKSLTSVAGLKTLGLGVIKQVKQFIAGLRFPSLADLKGAAPTPKIIKAFAKRVAAAVREFFGSVAQLKLPDGTECPHARLSLLRTRCTMCLRTLRTSFLRLQRIA
eukprot:COSAG02_NODE_3696_length_6372_cov_2.297306_1_plen_335_part_00